MGGQTEMSAHIVKYCVVKQIWYHHLCTNCFLTLFGKRERRARARPCVRSLVRMFVLFLSSHSFVDVSRCRRAGLAQFDSLRETVFFVIDVCALAANTHTRKHNVNIEINIFLLKIHVFYFSLLMPYRFNSVFFLFLSISLFRRCLHILFHFGSRHYIVYVCVFFSITFLFFRWSIVSNTNIYFEKQWKWRRSKKKRELYGYYNRNEHE